MSVDCRTGPGDLLLSSSTDLLGARLSPPLLFGGTLERLLGTDELGRDVLARLIYSIQISMLVAAGGTFISTLLGVSLGFLAAELGGVIDEGVMALVDMEAAVPFMITALLVITISGNSLALLVWLVGLHGWERHARNARGLALTARNRLHVTAARTYNASGAISTQGITACLCTYHRGRHDAWAHRDGSPGKHPELSGTGDTTADVQLG